MPTSVPELAPVFIVNPSANRSKALKRVGWLRNAVKEHWPGSRIVISKKAGDLARIGRDEAAKGHPVIACGGDGSINELINGVAGMDTVVGVLPMGSGNDFAKSMGIPLKKDAALRALRSADAAPIDLIRYDTNRGGGLCDNTLGIGFDGWANFHAHQNTVFKGTLQYLYATVKTAFTFKAVPMRLTLDELEITGDFLMVTLCNGTTEGGNFKVAPMADPTDGWMDVVMLGPLSIPGLFVRLPFFLTGSQFRFKDIRHMRCRSFSAEIGVPVGVHVDGEEVGENDVVVVRAEVVRSGVRVLRPKIVPNSGTKL